MPGFSCRMRSGRKLLTCPKCRSSPPARTCKRKLKITRKRLRKFRRRSLQLCDERFALCSSRELLRTSSLNTIASATSFMVMRFCRLALDTQVSFLFGQSKVALQNSLSPLDQFPRGQLARQAGFSLSSRATSISAPARTPMVDSHRISRGL